MTKRRGRILSVLLSLAMAVSLLPGTVLAANFTDVPAGAWYATDVNKAVALGLVNGKSATTYAPNDNLTYMEAVKLAACMHQKYTTGAVTLKNGTPWYQPYVDYARTNGIITKNYAWESTATRAGYMEIFSRALPDAALAPINSVADGAIPDVPMTHPQAGAIYKLYRAGVVQGVNANFVCSPASSIMRSEVATILVRMMDNSARKTFTIGNQTELTISQQPKAVTVQSGESAVFTVAASGGKTPYSYQWRGVDAGVPQQFGTNSPTLTMKNMDIGWNGFRFWCVVTDADGKTVVSEEAALTVKAAVADLTVTDPKDLTVKVGESATFSVTASGGKAPYTYEWHHIESNGDFALKDGDFYANAATATLTAKLCTVTNDNNTQFYCIVKDANGKSVTSGRATLTVKAPALTISTQPKDVTANEGEKATFTVTATGGKEPYAYQWYVVAPGSAAVTVTDATTAFVKLYGYSGATTATLSRASVGTGVGVLNGYQYYCVVTDADGKSVTSDRATLTVKAPALTISTQPKDVTVNEGEKATFTVTAAGGKEPYTYQWYVVAPGSMAKAVTDSTINAVLAGGYKGATTDTLTKYSAGYGDKTLNGYQYYCVVTDADGKSVTSGNATLTVRALTISTQPKAATVKEKGSCTFTVAASGGSGSYEYQWEWAHDGQVYKIEKFTGAERFYEFNTATLTYCDATPDHNGSQVRCVVTDKAAEKTATSNWVDLKVTSG